MLVTNGKGHIQDSTGDSSPDNPANNPENNICTLERPFGGETVIVYLDADTQYDLKFDLASAKSVTEENGALVCTFDDNSKIIFENAVSANFPKSDTHEVHLAGQDTFLNSMDMIDKLIAMMQVLEKQIAEGDEVKLHQVKYAAVVNELTLNLANLEPSDGKVLDDGTTEKSGKHAAKHEDAGTQNTLSAQDVQDMAAQALDKIAPAAGGGGGGGSSHSGFGFQSAAQPVSLQTLSAIGPIGETELHYHAEFRKPYGVGAKEDTPQPPSVPDDNPIVVQPDAKTLDETNLGPLSVKGHIDADYGRDGPGAIAPDGTYSVSGSVSAAGLTSDGVAVTVLKTATGYEGFANNVPVFTLTIDAATGDYTYTQLKPFDHADAANPNDVIMLNFGVTATDADGDQAGTFITINVLDDAPIAHNDVNQFDSDIGVATGNVVSGLHGGTGAADTLSKDNDNTVTKISFGNTTITVPAVGEATINGDHGQLKISADGSYTYTPFTTSTPSAPKEFIAGPAFPHLDEGHALDANAQKALGVAAGNLDIHDGDVVSVNYVSEGAGYNNTLGAFRVGADGTLQSVSVMIENGNDVGSTDTFQYSAGAGDAHIGFFLVADGYSTNNAYAGIDFSKGELSFVYDNGLATERTANISDNGSHVSLVYTYNGVETVIQGPIYFTTDRGSTDNLNPDGSVRTISGLSDSSDNTALRIGFEDLPDLGDRDYQDVIFDVRIQNPGTVSTGTDQFVYTLTDGDGDTSVATLDLTSLPGIHVDLTVNNNADAAYIKEDSQAVVPVSAVTTGGDGNEVMTLKVTGVNSTWNVTAPGWVNNGNGTYTLTLAAGQTTYNGNFTFKPPANSDVDMTGLHFTASVYNPDNGVTKTDAQDFAVYVDAVVDTPVLTVPETVQQAWYFDHQYYSTPLAIASHVTDTDGSEVVTKIVIKLDNPFTHPGGQYETLDDMGIKLNKGTETSPGVWEITVNNGDTTAALKGLSLIVPGTMNYWDIHQQDGLVHNGNITVISYVSEAHLGGQEWVPTDNDTTVIKNIALSFVITPLVLDLDGDGVNLVNIEHGVMFDMNNNGTLDQTSWVGSHDGLLAFDANHDGLINNQSELFGDSATAKDGFANLAQYDDNHDGRIDASDKIFNDLVVWRDLNQDGISQAGEKSSLADFNIVAINVNSVEVNLAQGDSIIMHESSFVYGDGSTGKIVDAGFNVREGDSLHDGAQIHGTDGKDSIYGTYGDDIIFGGGDSDILTGGAGADKFLFDAIDKGIDVIKDFSADEGDVLDFSSFFQGQDSAQQAINNFIFTRDVDGGTVVSIDVHGSGNAANAVDVVALQGVHDMNVQDLVQNGNIHVM